MQLGSSNRLSAALDVLDDFNLYAYTHDDPINGEGPTGLEDKQDKFSNDDDKCGSRVGIAFNCTSELGNIGTDKGGQKKQQPAQNQAPTGRTSRHQYYRTR